MRGAVPVIGDAFSAGFGNDEAHNRISTLAKAPSVQQQWNDLKQTFSAFGQAAKDAPKSYIKSKFGDNLASKMMIDKLYNQNQAGAANPNQQSEIGKFFSDAYNALPSAIKEPISGMAAGVGDAVRIAGQGITQGVTNKLTQYEGGRMAAQYALPIVDFFRNNPWAKWLLGGGAALGLYGIGKSLFGGGEQQEQQPYDPVTAAMNQGYAARMGAYR